MQNPIYNIKKLEDLLDRYNFNNIDKMIFIEIVKPIYFHEEFQKRLVAENFPHHGKLSLGEHILNDAIITYLICIKKLEKGINVNLKLAIIIAMFHDLYECPWPLSLPKNKIVNYHAFRHPIEAIVNAYTWFPEYFADKDEAEIIIDGIIHHMYPFPVRSINTKFKYLELNNLAKLKLMNKNIKRMIVESTNRKRIGNISFSKSRYLEGRIISRADKIATFKTEKKYLMILKATILGK